MTVHVAAIVFGFILAAIAGGGAMAGVPGESISARGERVLLGAVVGTPLLGAAVFFFSISGIPVSAWTLAPAAVVLRLAAAIVCPRVGTAENTAPFVGPSRMSGIALLFVSAISLAKIARVPLWSWDHFAFWGANSRRWALIPQTIGPIRFFRFHLLFQDYLAGLPVLWRTLCLGARPSPVDFKVCHMVFALMLLVAARRAMIVASGSATIGNVLTTWLASSPLFWDTEAVGLADLPLALLATAALVFMPGRANKRAALPFCICVASLPWIKNEGLMVAAGILSASAFLAPEGAARRRRVTFFAAFFVLVIFIAAAGRFFQVGETPTFFQGDWAGRAVSRLPVLPHLLWRMAVELLRPGWLGIWLVAAVTLAVSVLRGDGRARPFWLVLVIPFFADLGVYLATYLTPEAHIASSFGRISGALVPAALLAVGAALAGTEPGTERNLPAGASS